MFKRNPDAVALVLITGFLLVAGVAPSIRGIHRLSAPLIHVMPKNELKSRLLRSVASLKECLHLRSHLRPIRRPQ